jgi:hypothetical protein
VLVEDSVIWPFNTPNFKVFESSRSTYVRVSCHDFSSMTDLLISFRNHRLERRRKPSVRSLERTHGSISRRTRISSRLSRRLLLTVSDLRLPSSPLRESARFPESIGSSRLTHADDRRRQASGYEQALDYIRPGGTVVAVGLPPGAVVKSDVFFHVLYEKKLIGSYVGNRQDADEGKSLIALTHPQ